MGIMKNGRLTTHAQEQLNELKRNNRKRFREATELLKDIDKDPNSKAAKRKTGNLEGLLARAFDDRSSNGANKPGRILYSPPPPEIVVHRIGDHDYHKIKRDTWGCIIED